MKKSFFKVENMTEYFTSASGGTHSISEVVEELVRYMEEQPDKNYAITVGTDSELLPNKSANFTSAVVVRRLGNGGRYFWRHSNIGKFHTLRDRMIQEVLISIDLAKELLIALQTRARSDISWSFNQIHADVGEFGDTKAVLQEVKGMIIAHNFEAITKPLSYAATNVADRHV